MAEEIIPGIFRLPLPLPNLSLERVNLYLLKKDDGWILIDTGMDHPTAYKEFTQQLQTIGIRKDEIKLIILTHNHPDHSGMAGRLQEETNAALAIHENDMMRNESEDLEILDMTLLRNGLSESQIKQLINMGQQMSATSKPFHPDWLLKGYESIPADGHQFQVLSTPGHTPGHICLYDNERQVLLAGDHILPTITPNIAYGTHDPLGDYLSSLREIKELPVRIALPSHGSQISNTGKRIEEIIAHHDARTSQILDIAGKSRTALAIASNLEWKGGSVSWRDMKWDEQSMALLETLAHLQYMINKGNVSKTNDNKFEYYQAM